METADNCGSFGWNIHGQELLFDIWLETADNFGKSNKSSCPWMFQPNDPKLSAVFIQISNKSSCPWMFQPNDPKLSAVTAVSSQISDKRIRFLSLLSRTKRENDRRRMHLHVPWFKCVCLKSVFFNNSYIFVFVFYFIHHDHQSSLTKFLMQVYTIKELCRRKLWPSFWWKTLIV
jgi:hypothetical protein